MRRNKRLVEAGPEEILSIVDREPTNSVNVATAVSRLAKMARRTTNAVGGDGRWRALRGRVVYLRGALGARELANITHGYALLGRADCVGVADVPFKELALEIPRVADDFLPRHVGNVLWGFGKMRAYGKVPKRAFAALDAAIARTAPAMNAQEVANSLWGLTMFHRKPAPAATDALLAAVDALGGEDGSLDRQSISNVFWSLATLHLPPPEGCWARLCGGLRAVCALMNCQEASNVYWAVGSLGVGAAPRVVDVETKRALEALAFRLAPRLDVQGCSNCYRAFALLSWTPTRDARDALEAAAVRLAPDLNPLAVSSVIRGLAAIAAAGAGTADAPSADAVDALEVAFRREAKSMRAPELAKALASLRLVREPSERTLAKAAAALEHVGVYSCHVAESCLRTLGATAWYTPPATLLDTLARICPSEVRAALAAEFTDPTSAVAAALARAAADDGPSASKAADAPPTAAPEGAALEDAAGAPIMQGN